MISSSSNNNPFYGKKKLLKLFNSSDKNITLGMLNAAYQECDSKDSYKLFYTICFAIGDIKDRHHNIFNNISVDKGGHSNREGFNTFITWLWKKDKTQFIKFLQKNLFIEYNCFDSLILNRVKTKNSKIVKIYNRLADAEYREVLANYFANIIKINEPGNIRNRSLLAKFLSLPRIGKRRNHNKMLPQTIEVMNSKIEFLKLLSEKMGWEYIVSANYVNFKGYRQWRKHYNKMQESVMFSTQSILRLDEVEFKYWYKTLPKIARFRVRNRVFKGNPNFRRFADYIQDIEEDENIKRLEKKYHKSKYHIHKKATKHNNPYECLLDLFNSTRYILVKNTVL